MSSKSASGTISTRRSFLKSGTILAAPLAAVAAPAVLKADEDLKKRLALLENQTAIRDLHGKWLRSINFGVGDVDAVLFAAPEALRSLAAHPSGRPDAIEVADDGGNAVGRFHCIVEIETAIAQDCTIARMAHEQGGGFIRRTESRLLNVRYSKASGAWSIAKVELGEPLESEIG
jgi:hypothetical protein